ncbi:MAG TPA: Druantia anti-phage system protein DruA [Chitinophagaceae bacterium]|nr:Druantia anti-phage system protein DruA [Chitinophagaceae bacterium]
MTKQELRLEIIESLTNQGFSVNGHIVPSASTKKHFQKIQQHSRKEQILLQKNFLIDNINTVKKYLINGIDIEPEKIDLELRLVEEGTEENILFRWWNLAWWSVPYQRAYGRQMRFLLWDKYHNAPFGLIGLQSPVLKMAVRDKYLNIPKDDLDYIINQSLQAQRLGALPPYNKLLGGKMVALTVTSNEIRKEYQRKYKGSVTVLEKRQIDSNLLFVTTTSAFGRSSIYNRLKYNGENVAESLGYTKGSGTFHISEELYSKIIKFLKRRGVDINTTFGYGPSRKVKLIDKAFSLLGLSEYHYHNVQREFFIFPIAKNIDNVISKGVRPVSYNRPLTQLAEYWKERWAIPRSLRQEDWKAFDGNKFITATKRNISRWSN